MRHLVLTNNTSFCPKFGPLDYTPSNVDQRRCGGSSRGPAQAVNPPTNCSPTWLATLELPDNLGAAPDEVRSDAPRLSSKSIGGAPPSLIELVLRMRQHELETPRQHLEDCPVLGSCLAVHRATRAVGAVGLPSTSRRLSSHTEMLDQFTTLRRQTLPTASLDCLRNADLRNRQGEAVSRSTHGPRPQHSQFVEQGSGWCSPTRARSPSLK
jgi:hypothetical protein